MPIKWSAVKVSETVHEVEKQLVLADQFITEAKAIAREGKRIPKLPQYMEQRLNRLIDQLNRMDYIRESIKAIRSTIPDGAIEAETARARHGNQHSLI